MAPVLIPAISRRADQGDDSTLGPIYILGIALACVILVGIVAWLGWRRWKKGSAFEPDMISEKDGNGLMLGPRPHLHNKFNRAQMTASIILPAAAVRPINEKQADYESNNDEVSAIPYLPPLRRTAPLSRQMETSDAPLSAPPRAHSSAPLRSSALRQSFIPNMMQNGSPRATMTENEILDYHLNQGTMPAAFAPIAIESGVGGGRKSTYAFDRSNPRASQFSVMNGSVTASILSSVEKDQNRDSSSTMSSLPWPKLSAGPRKLQSPSPARASYFGHSRLSSFAASIRFPGSSPPTSPSRSVFTFGKTHSRQISQIPAATTENQRTVAIASFQPLLPDELVLRPNETMTVVQTYDDGWCIVARMNLGMLEVGAVPEWVFGLKEGEDETFGTMRPMRSTSLGVTVDLRVIESDSSLGRHFAAATPRDSLVSWSNF
ncbi:hypothetical protein M407DRAFT_123896 [Tulasnella calospora MUT 4182]|uniref:SH3 domain-containing protein n=1 Tax=Tulasnella calospora MUT 4182 TaxID=1051891 RepID=A0A0C3LJZ3_9AGAM|nr:hypothetical protein M407DRAFT_123896 [Tulasnella calospora MUT 4182]